MTDKQLLTYMGQPIDPHRVVGIEPVVIVCDKCGHEVDGDGEYWWHRDPHYELRDSETAPSDD